MYKLHLSESLVCPQTDDIVREITVGGLLRETASQHSSAPALIEVDMEGHAVMSNHYHLVVEVAPKRVCEWSDEEVAERWLRIGGSDDEHKRRAIVGNAARVTILRERLGDLSWFMKYINEPVARALRPHPAWVPRATALHGRPRAGPCPPTAPSNDADTHPLASFV